MRIYAISNNISLYQVNNTNPIRFQTSFKGDVFVKSPDTFNNRVEKFHKQMESDINIVRPADIKKMANRIAFQTGVESADVYKTMGILSKYSSYKSLKRVREFFSENSINTVSNLSSFYNDKYNKKPFCLTNAMHYISIRDFGFLKDDDIFQDCKKALFIDSKLLDIYENMSLGEKEFFEKQYLHKKNIQPVYIEDFENGYNIFNQGESFEDITVDVLNKAKKLNDQNRKGIIYNVHYILNAKNINRMKELGINAKIIHSKNIYTAKDITDNLNQPVPTAKEVKEIIEKIALNNKGHVEKNKDYIMTFLEKMSVFISQKQYCDYLKELHKKIDLYLKNNNIDKVYYAIPSSSKSFAIVNYQYMNVNKIKNPNYLYLSEESAEILHQINSLPKNSAVIILDDCVMSGSSLLREWFPYEHYARYFNKDTRIIFAPIIATKTGVKNLKRMMSGRKDDVIYNKILPKWDNNINKFSILYKYYTPDENQSMTSVILPYMGPDSNCEELVSFYEKFFINPSAQKPPVDCLDLPLFY